MLIPMTPPPLPLLPTLPPHSPPSLSLPPPPPPPPPPSDEHDVDVIGYCGGSDDDHSSVRSGTSNASDGGVAITTWRHLNIADPIH